MQLEQQLASGQLDLAVVTFPLSGDEIMAAQLSDEDLVVVLPADHTLSAQPSDPSSDCPSWSSCSQHRAPRCGPRSTVRRCRRGSRCGRPWSSMACGCSTRRWPSTGFGRPSSPRPRCRDTCGPILRAACHRPPPAPGRGGPAAARPALPAPARSVIDVLGPRGQRHPVHARGHPPHVGLGRCAAQDAPLRLTPHRPLQGPSPGSGTPSRPRTRGAGRTGCCAPWTTRGSRAAPPASQCTSTGRISALPTPLPCWSTAVPRLARYQCGSWGCWVSTVLRMRRVVTRGRHVGQHRHHGEDPPSPVSIGLPAGPRWPSRHGHRSCNNPRTAGNRPASGYGSTRAGPPRGVDGSGKCSSNTGSSQNVWASWDAIASTSRPPARRTSGRAGSGTMRDRWWQSPAAPWKKRGWKVKKLSAPPA